MRRAAPRLFLGLLILGGAAGQPAASQPTTVSWLPQTSGATGRLRGMSAVSPEVAWASGSQGTILRTTDGGEHWALRPVPGAQTLDFRDIDAMSALVAYALSIGTGESSRIYKTTDGGSTWSLQFQATDPRMFLDAMAFRDASHGIAFGDSIDGQFVILMTSDGGSTWSRVPKDRLPPALPNEGAFAASGTNVALDGRDRVWIATSASRVLRSFDRGRTWTIARTPLPTGPTAGIFSIAFRDARHGVIVGGDYKKESEAVDNVAFTSDGGTTWLLPKKHRLSGFRSVVAWISGSQSALVAGGPSGVDSSSDGGLTWKPGPGDGFDTLGFASSGTGWSAGLNGRISKGRAHSTLAR